MNCGLRSWKRSCRLSETAREKGERVPCIQPVFKQEQGSVFPLQHVFGICCHCTAINRRLHSSSWLNMTYLVGGLIVSCSGVVHAGGRGRDRCSCPSTAAARKPGFVRQELAFGIGTFHTARVSSNCGTCNKHDAWRRQEEYVLPLSMRSAPPAVSLRGRKNLVG